MWIGIIQEVLLKDMRIELALIYLGVKGQGYFLISNDLNYGFLSHRDSLNYILLALIFRRVAGLFIFNA